jgi:hypothetical protein
MKDIMRCIVVIVIRKMITWKVKVVLTVSIFDFEKLVTITKLLHIYLYFNSVFYNHTIIIFFLSRYKVLWVIEFPLVYRPRSADLPAIHRTQLSAAQLTAAQLTMAQFIAAQFTEHNSLSTEHNSPWKKN